MRAGLRRTAPLLLAAVFVAGVAAAGAFLADPGRAEPPLPLSSSRPPAGQTFTGIDDLKEFARFAYADLSRNDWAALGNSLAPGAAGPGEPCDPESFSARAAEHVRRAALEAEAALARTQPLYAQLVELPELEWELAGVEVADGEAQTTRRARAFGRSIAPPVLRVDRWVVAGGAWWLDPASIASGAASLPLASDCGEAAMSEEDEAGAFARPLPEGASAEMTDSGGRLLSVRLTPGKRGDGPPAPAGFEYVPFEARVESQDGSQLGLPLTFQAATFDGWLLDRPIATTTDICPGTESTGVTCQLTRGRALAAVDDPAPRIAWAPQGLNERAEGFVWWRLPALLRNGEPVVVDLDEAEAAQALTAAGVPLGEWKTDFLRMTVDPAELLASGTRRPPRSALNIGSAGAYDSVTDADEWMGDAEPVLAVEAGGEARAYPLRVLIWHPIVNDELGSKPVLATYSPLTNTALAFERRVGIAAPLFQASGALRFNNQLLYDEATESWWQQGTGEAVAGELAGSRLALLPGLLISWAEFKRAYPNDAALSVNAGFAGDYDFNPYFDADFNPPEALHGGELDPRMPAHARVLGLRAGGEALAVPLSGLDAGPAQFEFGGAPTVVFWAPGTASALSHIDIARGRDVGAAAAFDSRVDGQRLTFSREGKLFVDAQTGSEWSVSGRAVGGPLEGRRLQPAPQTNSFWFAWAALNPGGEIFRGGQGAS